MQRFYIPYFEKKDIFILDDKDIFHQLVKVLRVRVWEQIIFFDWVKNIDFVFEIVEINKKNIELKFVEEIEKETELSFELNLFQAMPNKMEKIEYILQKWVEIGYRKFVFYRSERSQKMVISDKKLERLKKIIVEAVEQSWRSFVPEFEIKVGNENFHSLQGESLFLHTKNNNSQNLSELINSLLTEGFSPLQKIKQNLNIFIWPEGWFSEIEIENFEKNNFSRIHLWNRILRTETAGIVVWFTLWQMI